MKANAFRILVVIPLLFSLLNSIYQPAQASSPAAPALSPAPAPLAAVPNAPVLVSPADGATQLASPVVLTVHASDPDGGTLKVSFYGRKKTTDTAPSFSIAAIPDTQNYVETTSGTATFNAMMQYIADSQTARNTVFVTHMGDITNNGDLDTDQSEWIVADNAMRILERSSATAADDVPYSVMPGNHDALGGLVNYNLYFPVSRFAGTPYYGGHYGTDNIANYSTFAASGMHFIVINIPCFSGYPTTAMLNWTDSLLKDDVSRRGIVACHAAMNPDNTFTYIGQAVFDALKDNPNLFMILAGHAGIARRQDVGTDGHTIFTMMSDYSGYINGGDGLYRIYQFQPASNQIQALTYSPTRNNGAGAYLTGSADQFTLPYSMRSPDFNLIGTTTVSSGADASITWSGLLGGTQYEWYAVARDAADVSVGTTQSFLTGPMSSAPLAQNDNYATNEDAALTVSAPGVLANDSDPDGKSLSAALVSSPANGAITLGSTGGFTYTPNLNFNGTDSFTYQASDGTSSTDTATVTITVNPMNDAPVGNKDSASTLEDTPVVVNVLANDTDIDGDTLKVSSVSTLPLNGVAVVQADSTILYTPNPKFYGIDSFRYAVKDGFGGASSAKVTVTVTHVNHAPDASSGSISTAEDTPAAVNLVASDYDGDSLTYTLIDTPQHGTLSGAAPALTYTPDANYYGPDALTFQVKDAALTSSIATVAIQVTPVNDAPVCADLSVTINEDSAQDIPANCTDVEGSPLTIRLVDAPTHGQVSIAGGVFHYQPDANDNGSDSFTFRASDGSLDSNLADGSVTILPVDDPPVCQQITSTISEDTSLLDDPLCVDVDSPTLSYLIAGQPKHGKASIDNGKLRYQPASKYYGTDSFTYQAYDGALYSDSMPVWVTVNQVIYPPVMGSIGPLAVDEGSLLTFTAPVSAGDIPLASLTYQLSGNVPAGADLSSDGVFTWTPSEAQGPGSFDFNLCAADGVNAPVCQPVRVAVSEVNQAPVLEAVPAQQARRDTLLTFTVHAADADLPENALTYTLQGDVPQGALLDPVSGVFNWQTSPDQPLRAYQFAICASDGTAQDCKPVTVSVMGLFFLPAVMAGG